VGRSKESSLLPRNRSPKRFVENPMRNLGVAGQEFLPASLQNRWAKCTGQGVPEGLRLRWRYKKVLRGGGSVGEQGCYFLGRNTSNWVGFQVHRGPPVQGNESLRPQPQTGEGGVCQGARGGDCQRESSSSCDLLKIRGWTPGSEKPERRPSWVYFYFPNYMKGGGSGNYQGSLLKGGGGTGAWRHLLPTFLLKGAGQGGHVTSRGGATERVEGLLVLFEKRLWGEGSGERSSAEEAALKVGKKKLHVVVGSVERGKTGPTVETKKPL